MFPKRAGLIVWVHDIKQAKNLERIGHVVYTSKKLNYILLYVDDSHKEEKLNYLRKLNFVKKIEESLRSDINTLFTNKNYVRS